MRENVIETKLEIVRKYPRFCSTNQEAEMMLTGSSCDLDGMKCDSMGHIVEINWGEYALIELIKFLLYHCIMNYNLYR